MPEVRELQIADGARMGVAVEGSVVPLQNGLHDESLLAFDVFNQQQRYIDVFSARKRNIRFRSDRERAVDCGHARARYGREGPAAVGDD